MFRTIGILDRELLKELSGFMVGRRKKRLLFIVGSCFVCWGVLGLWRSYYFGTVLAAIAVGIFLVEYQMVKRRMVKINLRRREELGTGRRQMVVWFDGEGARLSAEDGTDPYTLRYENFEDFVETKHLYALKTSGKMVVTVFKDQLSVDQQAEFKAFLREKPTKIKPSRLR